MSGWQPIATAPRDGTPVLLRGGDVTQPDHQALPVVVGFFGYMMYGKFDTWYYAYWDGGWYSEYVSPTEWHPIPE